MSARYEVRDGIAVITLDNPPVNGLGHATRTDAAAGIARGEFVRREPGGWAIVMAELAAWYADGRIKPAIDQVLPMNRLPEAYARMASRLVRGKLVVTNA